MGVQRRSGSDQQVEERLAILLRPGPRRVRPDPTADDASAAEVGVRMVTASHDSADNETSANGLAGSAVDPAADDTLIGDSAAVPVGQDDWGEPAGGEAFAELLEPAVDPPREQPWPRRQQFTGRIGEGLRALVPIDQFGGFGRPQLVVIAVIVLLGLGFGGWAVLRARPVAIAAPHRPSASATSDAADPGTGSSRSTDPAAPTPTAQTPTAQTPAVKTPTAPQSSTQPGAASSTGAPESMIKVHVLGAVHDPGVVTLPAGSRVQDGLDKAGGVKKSADLGDLNLAQPLLDGQQIFIGRGNAGSEVRGPAPPASTGGVPGSGQVSSGPPATGPGSAPATADGPVNLNTATLEQLDGLPGVGPVTAQKILDWRAEHGRFSSIEELQEVDGIGPKTYADLAGQVTT